MSAVGPRVGLVLIRGNVDKRRRVPGHHVTVRRPRPGSWSHLVVGDTRAVAVEHGRLVTQPRHQPVSSDLAGPVAQEGRVVTVAQLAEGDDDGGKAEDDVQETDDDEDGVDEHGGFTRGWRTEGDVTDVVSVLVRDDAIGSVGVCSQAGGGVDDHHDGGDQGT